MDYNNFSTPPSFFESSAVQKQTNAIMKRVYLRMFIGLLISAFCALGVASSPAAIGFFFGNKIVFWGMLIAMFVMAFMIPMRLNKMASGTVLLLFCVFSALMGIWLTPIFYAYAPKVITATFFITAGTFGAMSVYGYFTKSNLDKMGTYLMMALFGLIILMIVNLIFFRNEPNSTLYWIISIVGVLIFIGLTAYDTQQVKRLAAANLEPSLADKLATMGAMNLYLDFINLFLFLLRIFGAGGRD